MAEPNQTTGSGDPGGSGPSLSAHPNLRLFIWFRILFNCRFYYPVYMILFLDYGLSLEQFGILNAVWAFTICLLEVPSGALADRLGRRALVVAASVLMVIEMLVLIAAPVGSWLVFYLFLINRLLSGAAEAAASGADEALAYDSIPADSRESVWPQVMSRMMIGMSIVSVVVMSTGAVVYDAGLMNVIAEFFGWHPHLEQSDTVRFPIILNVFMAVGALVVSLRMREVSHQPTPEDETASGRDDEASASGPGHETTSFRAVLDAGQWILHTPAALVLILIGLSFDSIIRLYYTVNSNVLRVLQIPESSFGIIGAGGALLGILAAVIVKPIHARVTPSSAFHIVALLVAIGLTGFIFPIPYYGVALLVPFWFAMRFLHYFLSQYLNRVTPSAMRATVLSFRGLTMNISYGVLTLLFSVQSNLMTPEDSVANSRDLVVFTRSIQWWLPFFILMLIVLYGFIRLRYRSSVTGLLRPGDTETS